MDQRTKKRKSQQNACMMTAGDEEMAILESLVIGAAAVGILDKNFKIKNRTAKILRLKPAN